MRKLAALAVLAAVGSVAPAQAEKPPRPDRPVMPDRPDRRVPPAKPAKPAKDRCVAHAVGFNAAGTLVGAALTAGEPGLYNGTLTVHVTRANHGAPTGDQTYTLANARVRFRSGVDAAAPAAGSHVRVQGKITRLRRGCPTADFTPTVTVRRVEIRTARPTPPDPAPAPEPES